MVPDAGTVPAINKEQSRRVAARGGAPHSNAAAAASMVAAKRSLQARRLDHRIAGHTEDRIGAGDGVLMPLPSTIVRYICPRKLRATRCGRDGIVTENGGCSRSVPLIGVDVAG